MAASRSKDQPPAYTSQDDQASTTGDSAEPSKSTVLKPNHSTRASNLSHAISQREYTKFEYLELTFPVMIFCGFFEPVVLAIDEDHDTLLSDLQRIFNVRTREMRVVWGDGWGGGSMGRDLAMMGSVVQPGNITAMLRLLKSKNGADYIHVN
ncbi:MAG: hypothetical protein ASARMPRED_001118 [Alectoria sarmentosa]|nr:MAG: hypothetical protein ASARMPRED_001118 [Alectoria sarmentosa]